MDMLQLQHYREKHEKLKKSAWVLGGGVPVDIVLGIGMFYNFEDGTTVDLEKRTAANTRYNRLYGG
ncbi:uncharacterized protein N7479_000607 [Penicillium vulpinum]|uniref:uncharacterized protein n=1 Tax=Penicillium vulpinum TaxID=29845 RepID=UPI0025483868|nr:uncharacterized protein N7479_000607 [Penicillium vulpinum]KAJ5970689.1 hypothetical protein N7479_000607 [Penicillium vulpinum]